MPNEQNRTRFGTPFTREQLEAATALLQLNNINEPVVTEEAVRSAMAEQLGVDSDVFVTPRFSGSSAIYNSGSYARNNRPASTSGNGRTRNLRSSGVGQAVPYTAQVRPVTDAETMRALFQQAGNEAAASIANLYDGLEAHDSSPAIEDWDTPTTANEQLDYDPSCSCSDCVRYRRQHGIGSQDSQPFGEDDDFESFPNSPSYSYGESESHSSISLDEPYIESPPYHLVGNRDLTSFEMPTWDSKERDMIVDLWFKQMDYRIRWIFYREEREGINRQRYTNPFSPEDFKNKVAKAKKVHPLTNETNTFYDWAIGGTDFIMRCESYKLKDNDCLRLHFIHKGSDKQIGYKDMIWDGQQYRELDMAWAEVE